MKKDKDAHKLPYGRASKNDFVSKEASRLHVHQRGVKKIQLESGS